MAFLFNDRVKETSSSTGLSDFALSGAVTGFQSFSAGIGANNTCYYAVTDGTDWEVGLGTISSDGLTLARTTILQSSSSDSKVNFGSGEKTIFCTYPASKAVDTDNAQTLTAKTLINSPSIDFDTTITPTEAVGKMQWDDGNGTLQFGLKGGNVNLQVGQEIVARVYNDSGVALTDGQIVYISGAQGNRIAVKLALADSDANSAGTLGMVTEPIAIGAEGFITILGTVNGLDTSALTAGALVYLSPTVAGAYTTTKPSAPQHTVTLGYVERVHATVGSIYVKVDNGYELDELHNVLITSPTSGNTLIYDAVQGVWENANISAGTGVSVTNGAGSITIANTAPDQTVSLTGAGTTSISGTYPNFTITSNDEFDGTVTSVAATAGTGISVTGSPITSSGTLTITNTAPDQVVSLTAGTGISTSGTYPSFTVTNTAPDQTVSLTAGTGISVTGTYPSFTVTNTGLASYPSAGIPNSTGSAWGTSYTTSGSGTVVALATGATLTNPSAVGTLTEDVYTITDGAGFAIDPTNGSIQLVTLGASRTPTQANWSAGQGVTLMIADGTAYTITWTTIGVTWVGGTAPTLATTGYTVIELWKVGTTIYGANVGSVA